jgi:hypothetical protein
MMMTVLSMSMVTAIGSADAATAEAGDLIKMEGLSSVYYLGEDGKRYVFPNEDTYFSWYSDFSSVVTISQSELESYPLGSNVNIRPGTHLVKITTDPKVYAVEEGGSLRAIPDEDTAETLYGANWADRVVDVPDAFFVNYTIDEGNEVSADAYPQGTLVKPQGGSDVYYINADGEAQPIADEAAFEANRFQWKFVTTASSDYSLPTQGAEITSADESRIDPSEGASGDVTGPVGSGLSVALASDTPASASIPAGGDQGYAAALAPFTKVNFTASNDGAVTIEDLTVKRIGVGDEDELGDVYVYDGVNKLTNGKSIASDQTTTFDLDYEVPAGQTKTLTIRANVFAGNGTSGNHGFAVQTASAVETDGASVSGSFPVKGNLMSLAAVDQSALSVTLDDGSDLNSNIKVGEEDQELAELEIEELSGEEDVKLHQVTLMNEGSIDAEDLSNLELKLGNDVLAEISSPDSDELTFTLDEPLTIEDGETETLVLEGDIEDGSGDTLLFEIDEATDIVALGQEYGFSPDVTLSSDTTGEYTVKTGEFTMSESDNNPNSQDRSRGEDDVTFLAAEVEASDQPITLTEYTVDIDLNNITSGSTSTNAYLENLTLYLDGSRVAGPNDVDLTNEDATTSVTFDEEFTVDGVQELTVEADITDDAAKGTYSMSMDNDDITAEDDAGDDIDGDEINGDAQGNNVDVGLGTNQVAKDNTLGNKEVVAGSDDILIGKYIVEASESEGLDIKEYTVNLSFTQNTVTTVIEASDVEDLYVNDESSISSPVAGDNDFSVSEELAAGETKIVNVYLSIDDNLDSDKVGSNISTTLSVDAEGLVSGDEVTEAGFADNDSGSKTKSGQTMTVAQGTLSLSKGADTPSKQILIAGSQDVEVAEFEFAAENIGYEITEMTIGVYTGPSTSSSSEEAAVTTVTVDGTEKNLINGSADVSTGVRVEADEETTVSVSADLNDDFDSIDSGDEIYLAVTDYKYIADNDTAETEVNDANVITTNKLAIYNTELTVNAMEGDTTLANGDNDIMDIKFTADSADKAVVNQLAVDVTPTEDDGNGDLDITRVELIDSNDDVVASDAASSTGTWTLTMDNPDADATIAAGSSKTYSVRVVTTGVQADDSVLVELVETDFQWDDDEYYDENSSNYISDNTDLIDDLDGSFESIR